jgi:hypothetical protein
MLEMMVPPSERNEEPSKGSHFALFLTLLHVVEHRAREGSYDERKYFLEGDHYLKSYNLNR